MLRRQTQEIFGADNWLEEELKRENRISAWDMDGGKQLRMEHEENCDARNLAAEHALDCAAEENAARHRTEHRTEQLDPGFRRAIVSGNQSGETPEVSKVSVLMIFGALFAIFVLAAVIPFLAPLVPVIGIIVTIAANKKKNDRQ